MGAECLTVAVTLSQSDTKALNPSPNTAPAVLKANTVSTPLRVCHSAHVDTVKHLLNLSCFHA